MSRMDVPRSRRAVLFIKDYLSEFGCAWSMARMRDCERNGGHRWGPTEKSDSPYNNRSRTCGRCGCYSFWNEAGT